MLDTLKTAPATVPAPSCAGIKQRQQATWATGEPVTSTLTAPQK